MTHRNLTNEEREVLKTLVDKAVRRRHRKEPRITPRYRKAKP